MEKSNFNVEEFFNGRTVEETLKKVMEKIQILSMNFSKKIGRFYHFL